MDIVVDILNQFRRTLTSGTIFIARLRASGRRKIPIKGVPDGIDIEKLNELCFHHTGEHIKQVSYYHLSGWKTRGAFRLFIMTERGYYWNLIYKNAVYRTSQIPALKGLPLVPGPSEYLIYNNAVGLLTKYLPKIYLCQEVIPDVQYKYLLEDFGMEYQNATVKNVISLTTELTSIHEALNEWSFKIDKNYLLKYNYKYSIALQEYARKNLERYIHKMPGQNTLKVLELWNEILEVHDKTFDFHQNHTIHGDLNLANIMVHVKDPNRIKLIDWEWAGIGIPHADLASILMWVSPEIEQKVLKLYAKHEDHISINEHIILYRLCQLERGILDAAFLAAQHMDTSIFTKFKSTMNMPKYIEDSMYRVLKAYQVLRTELE